MSYPSASMAHRKRVEDARREARAEALREAAGIVSSEATDEWRKARGEEMPGGISKPGAQVAAMRLDIVASIIRDRAEEEQE